MPKGLVGNFIKEKKQLKVLNKCCTYLLKTQSTLIVKMSIIKLLADEFEISKLSLSHDITSVSDIMQCFKIDKPLVVYIIVTLCNDSLQLEVMVTFL